MSIFYLRILCFLRKKKYPTKHATNSVIGNAHQINDTPTCPFLTKIENIPAKGNIITNCRKSEIISDSIPPSKAWKIP